MFNKTKEENYFDMFITSVDFSLEAAEALLSLIKNYTDVDKKVKDIHTIEHSGDMHFHKLYEQLMRSFMTPIDREDILLLAQKIDDVTDLIEDIAYKFVMFDIKILRPDVETFIGLIVKSCKLMKTAIIEFKNFSKSKDLSNKILQINDIEEEADTIYKNAVRALFTTNQEAVEIFKWRELYGTMENCIDACEDVADAMNGVILKNS